MDTRLPHSDEFPIVTSQVMPPHTPTARDSIQDTWTEAAKGYDWIAPTGKTAKLIEIHHGDIFSMALDLSNASQKNVGWDAASFFQKHGADSSAGIALMMLAESLARAPDEASRQALLFDILPRAQWDESEGHRSFPIDALASAASRIEKWDPSGRIGNGAKDFAQSAAAKIAMQSISIFANAFISGKDANALVGLSKKKPLRSFDMLGENASTELEADHYFLRYMEAVNRLPTNSGNPWDGHGISVKLSALDPLFDFRHAQRNVAKDRLLELARACESKNLLLTVDAEEAERLDPMLEAVEHVLSHLQSKSYEGFGWAIQSNLRSCQHAIAHAIALAKRDKRRLPIRVVKGAYWDYETREAISGGYPNPAWPAKRFTDRAWICAANELFHEPYVYPMLATHNPHSCACAISLNKLIKGPFEFQRLHGMGEALHDQLLSRGYISRVYSPIGPTQELLPYLARRMLENGANTSILRTHEHGDPGIALANPFFAAPEKLAPQWTDAYEPTRANSPGMPLWMSSHRQQAQAVIKPSHEADASFGPKTISPCGEHVSLNATPKTPTDSFESILTRAHECHLLGGVDSQHAHEALNRCCKILERKKISIISTIVHETGKCFADAANEWREAYDFCAFHSRLSLSCRNPRELPSIPGEENYAWRVPRGAALCIGPWNFPFAILMGQVTGALAAGCPVVFKGASASPQCSTMVRTCLQEAGFSADEVQCVVAPASAMSFFIEDARIATVAFTGSTESAQNIAISLASRKGPLGKLIAETGGFNIMLVDETAHLDSACSDILESAFNMSGQRCSALRSVWIDDRIFDALSAKLQGALRLKVVSDPSNNIDADFGPLIDAAAASEARESLDRLLAIPGNILCGRAQISPELGPAYFSPAIVETTPDKVLREEIFAPILQMVRFKQGQENVLNSSWAQGGYGLTFGIQTRKPKASEQWARKIPAGNIYINRSMIGAVVGAQPFGGEGLSGTGPKIGGEDYPLAFCSERALSSNSAAFGGCIDLLGDRRSSLQNFFPES